MRDARNVREGDDFVLETTPEEALMEQFGLTPEEYEATIAQVTADAENLDVFRVVNVDEELPCIATFNEYASWHTSVGLTTDVNVDYQTYVAVCDATEEELFIPQTEEVTTADTNDKLLKIGAVVGGAYLLFSLGKK